MTYNVDKVRSALTYWAKDIHNVFDYAKPIIQNDNFYLWSGSSKPIQHHYGQGGLAQHTYEVIRNCRIIADEYSLSSTERTNLFLAALYHDIGKMWDYSPVEGSHYTEWEKTEHLYLIHHISRSMIEFNKHCSDYQFKDDVIHCILAHHGQREWGSPVRPRTKIAWILHLCDGLSARINDLGGIHV